MKCKIILVMTLLFITGFVQADLVIDGGGSRLALTSSGVLKISSATKVPLKILKKYIEKQAIPK